MKKIISLLFLCVGAHTTLGFDTTFVALDRFLAKHVCSSGVNYTTAQNDPLLDSILSDIAALPSVQYEKMSENTKLALLINLYNVATIKRITQAMPIKSIKDIPSAWSKKWIFFNNKKISLDNIEHDMIRKQFNEPHIHTVLVCAAKSCPTLRNKAYTPFDLNKQLTEETKLFLSDTTKNSIGETTLYISAIFNWYGGDFVKPYGSVVNFIKQTMNLTGPYKISYKNYDWSLNSVDCTQ